MRSIIQGALVGVLVGLAVVFGGRAAGLFPQHQSFPVAAPVVVAPVVEPPSPPAAPMAKDETVNPVFTDDRLWVRGYIQRGNRINVMLSDGSILSEGITELTLVSRTYIVLAGKKYPILQPIQQCIREEGTGVSKKRAGARTWGITEEAQAQQDAGITQLGETPGLSRSATAPGGGSWRTDPDGVQRLVSPQTIGR